MQTKQKPRPVIKQVEIQGDAVTRWHCFPEASLSNGNMACLIRTQTDWHPGVFQNVLDMRTPFANRKNQESQMLFFFLFIRSAAPSPGQAIFYQKSLQFSAKVSQVL